MIIVIPASMSSRRIPDKPLVKLGSETLVEHTLHRAKGASSANVFVASDNTEVLRLADGHGIHTSNADNGTKRAWQALCSMKRDDDDEVVVNWQVDEPFVPAEHVVQAADQLLNTSHDIATLVCSLPDWKVSDHSTVKAAVNEGTAYWFSRAPLAGAFEHVGVYIFRCRDTLKAAASCPSSFPARAESLEQLDWLCAGMTIMAWQVDIEHLAINDAKDLQSAQAFWVV